MRKICVVTGTRAEYGLLYWTMKEIQNSSELNLQLIVTGMHLSPKFGETWKQIEKDGFNIDYRVDLGEMGNDRRSTAQQIAKGVIGFTEAFESLKPDLVVILGDRYEMLAVAQAALILNIPISHIHGGEVTEGAFDDAIRHSITKMSYLHFTSTEVYRQRVIQMGESPDRVFNVGAPGLENFKRLNLLSKEELSQQLGFELQEKNMLITYHPVTAVEEHGIDELIAALSAFPDCGQIITMPNSDPGHEEIMEKWQIYAANNSNVYLTTSLGQLRYLSAMKIANLVIGNSSSGIIEAPFCGVPTINIGERQKGRLAAQSVTHVKKISSDAIKSALDKKSEESNLYGEGNSAKKIVDELVKFVSFHSKGFYDMKGTL